MRYKVTLSIEIEAKTAIEAKRKLQKLADTINEKDPDNKAWIPMVSEVKCIINGKKVLL